MTSLLADCRTFEKIARKERKNLLSFNDFNKKYKTNIPVNEKTNQIHANFVKKWAKAKKVGEFPIRTRLGNLYKQLSENKSPSVNLSRNITKVSIPDNTIHPSVPRITKTKAVKKKSVTLVSNQEIRKKQKIDPMQSFQNELQNYLKRNKKSVLNQSTQIVYFVPPDKVQNFEHFAAKLTRSHGELLKTGGIFKMRNGQKRNIQGIDLKQSNEVYNNVLNGGKGPFFIKISCNTGASNCNCHK
tara:strand:+ start:105 stop:833 length:729 start_codon:yes stop_codon:yes gene_type:complete